MGSWILETGRNPGSVNRKPEIPPVLMKENIFGKDASDLQAPLPQAVYDHRHAVKQGCPSSQVHKELDLTGMPEAWMKGEPSSCRLFLKCLVVQWGWHCSHTALQFAPTLRVLD